MKNFYYFLVTLFFFSSPVLSDICDIDCNSIKFFNGFVLEERELDSGWPGKNYKLINLNTNQVVKSFDAVRGKIKETFFSSDTKELVAIIINESDGGSGGWSEWDTLLFGFGDQVHRVEFPNTIKLEIDIHKTSLRSLTVIEEIPAINNLGDEVFINEFYRLVEYIYGQAHVIEENKRTFGNRGLKLKYERLLNQPIWNFLGSETYRIDLINEIGIKKYIDFRDLITINVPGNLLLRDKFILMGGTKKYEFHNYALVILDGFTGEVTLIKYTPSELNAEIITDTPLNKTFLDLFPFTYDCLKFISDGKSLSIKKAIFCS